MSIRVLFVLFQCVLSALVEGSITDSHHTSLRATDVSKLTLFFRNQSEVGFSRAHNTIPPNNEVKQLYKDTNRKVGNYQCGRTFVTLSSTSKYEYCPMECPYFAQDKSDDRHCSFLCVPAEECMRHNPSKPIADLAKGICRAPAVSNCEELSMDGADACKRCRRFFYLGGDGDCHYRFMWVLWSLLAVLVTLVILIIVWVVDLILRKDVNPHGVKQGLSQRSKRRLHMPKSPGNRKRRLWPKMTNLLREMVAGPGLCLHFNFQFMVIIWALLVALGWVFLAMMTDSTLFYLGTRKFGTALKNCILVAWGYETQQRLMPAKVGFLAWVYVITFVGCILHSIRQLRYYQLADFKNKTMKDYAAFITGLPHLNGDIRVEEELKNAVIEATQLTDSSVIGASVCWNFSEKREYFTGKLVSQEMKNDTNLILGRRNSITKKIDPSVLKFPRREFWKWEQQLLVGLPEEQINGDTPREQIKEILQNIQTSEHAFIVFNTERDRNKAAERLEALGGFMFHGARVRMEICCQEPGSVYWANFNNSTFTDKLILLSKGFGLILLGLLFWTLVFYGPYAWSIASFDYSNGNEPGIVYSISFSMVVVIGNAIMYQICALVSDFVGFRFKDDREACYMILYTVACVFNVALDLVTTYYMVLERMKGLGFKTFHGTKLQHIDEFNEQFETYAMQRALGENAFSYAFPSTFLIPFLLEPFITNVIPKQLGKLLVRSHPDIIGTAAENMLAAPELEMGRYADILLNILLAILIFYFPGGYTWKLFFGMAISHCYIYVHDHFKVLRSIPTCTFATMQIDWWSQAMLAPCCGLILGCLIFKANGQGFGYDIQGDMIVVVSFCACVAHVLVHLLLLRIVVPLFGRQDSDTSAGETDPDKDFTYKELNSSVAQGWFSVNPIHCFRSEHIYGHDPPCQYFIAGREQALEINEDIGCYFKDEEEPEEEDSCEKEDSKERS